jgi:hypothetical protein
MALTTMNSLASLLKYQHKLGEAEVLTVTEHGQ